MAKYAFMLQTEITEPGRYPVTKMSRWLEVSRSGYYDWKGRKPSARAQRREEIVALVRWSFERSNGTYGHRRVHADLTRRGIAVGLDLVREIMAEEALVACQPRPWRTTTIPGGPQGPADLLERDFSADRPGVKLVGDITYIHTWTGFAYLATVIDCHHKGVIGWAVADHMRTDLVVEALEMAGRNHDLQPNCIFHSDRGTQYTSTQLREFLADRDMRGSMGRTGICWDNAMAESFFAALKNELVHRTVFPSIAHAKRAVGYYIEVFYNRARLHSSLGYRTPHEVLTDYLNNPTAA